MSQARGAAYNMLNLVSLRRDQLIRLFVAMGQQTTKNKPTRLELLGAAVTLLYALRRLSL